MVRNNPIKHIARVHTLLHRRGWQAIVPVNRETLPCVEVKFSRRIPESRADTYMHTDPERVIDVIYHDTSVT